LTLYAVHQYLPSLLQGVDIESIPCTPNLTTLDMGNAYWLRSGSVRFSKVRGQPPLWCPSLNQGQQQQLLSNWGGMQPQR
jgi:hypothetical protein